MDQSGISIIGLQLLDDCGYIIQYIMAYTYHEQACVQKVLKETAIIAQNNRKTIFDHKISKQTNQLTIISQTQFLNQYFIYYESKLLNQLYYIFDTMQDPYRLIEQIQKNFFDQIRKIWPYFLSPPRTNEDHPHLHHHYDPEKISDDGESISFNFFSEPVYIRNRSETDHQKSLQKQSQKICEKEALNMNEQKPLTFDEQMPEKEPDPNRNPQSQSQASTNLQEHPKGYPTKNFLQSFKTCFLKYLEQKMGSQAFHSIQLIKKIKNKSLNLKDYEAIFKTACFKPILQQFFENKTLDRFLLQSRIKYSLKKIYYLKLHVFQSGFINQHFKAIN